MTTTANGYYDENNSWVCTTRPAEVGDPALRSMLAAELLVVRHLIHAHGHSPQSRALYRSFANGLRRAFEALAWQKYLDLQAQRQRAQRVLTINSINAHHNAS